MWICPRCHTENRDAFPACESCGAARSAGRFGSSPGNRESVARAPRVTAAAPSGDAIPRPAASARAAYQPPETEMPPAAAPRKRGAAARLARLVGGALCVLLPALTALLAVRQYDALSGALLPLLLSETTADAARLLCYLALALIAGLLSLLPGLWTLLLARPYKNRK